MWRKAGSKSGRERRETGQRGLGEGTGDRSERQVWEKELETGQRDRSGRRNWRQVRETGLGEGTGDRSECLLHFNTAAVTELVHVKITAVTECTLTQQR